MHRGELAWQSLHRGCSLGLAVSREIVQVELMSCKCLCVFVFAVTRESESALSPLHSSSGSHSFPSPTAQEWFDSNNPPIEI